jgi:hypothetical protein
LFPPDSFEILVSSWLIIHFLSDMKVFDQNLCNVTQSFGFAHYPKEEEEPWHYRQPYLLEPLSYHRPGYWNLGGDLAWA